MKRCSLALSARLIAILLLTAPLATADAPFDVLIRGGRIVDGSGAPWYVADVGIADGRIQQIGRIDSDQTETVIDASGLVVAPGFVDMMGQTASLAGAIDSMLHQAAAKVGDWPQRDEFERFATSR